MKVTEVKELTPVVKQTAWERISLGFLGSLQNIVDGIVEICIWFVINIPYLVLWAAFIGIVVWILRKRGRKRQKKNQNDTWEKDLHRREQTGPEIRQQESQIRQQESQIPQQESQMQQQNKEDGTN